MPLVFLLLSVEGVLQDHLNKVPDVIVVLHDPGCGPHNNAEDSPEVLSHFSFGLVLLLQHLIKVGG